MSRKTFWHYLTLQNSLIPSYPVDSLVVVFHMEAIMTSQQRAMRAQEILHRQDTGNLTPWDAARELDALLMEDSDELIFFSDSTGITASWDADLMLFPKTDRTPSNTGIYARGPKRGAVVTVPEGAAPNCNQEVLEHFYKLIANTKTEMTPRYYLNQS